MPTRFVLLGSRNQSTRHTTVLLLGNYIWKGEGIITCWSANENLEGLFFEVE
ncbi:hypothetical protein ACB092_09G176800 [Castanea dentata]